MNTIFSNLTEVAKKVSSIDAELSKGLDNLAAHFAKIEKQSRLINDTDKVICVDNFPPLFKGRRYIVSDSTIPGYLAVKEEEGGDVGIFAINRFVLDNNEQ